jgi:hypothetical protein
MFAGARRSARGVQGSAHDYCRNSGLLPRRSRRIEFSKNRFDNCLVIVKLRFRWVVQGGRTTSGAKPSRAARATEFLGELPAHGGCVVFRDSR